MSEGVKISKDTARQWSKAIKRLTAPDNTIGIGQSNALQDRLIFLAKLGSKTTVDSQDRYAWQEQGIADAVGSGDDAITLTDLPGGKTGTTTDNYATAISLAGGTNDYVVLFQLWKNDHYQNVYFPLTNHAQLHRDVISVSSTYTAGHYATGPVQLNLTIVGGQGGDNYLGTGFYISGCRDAYSRGNPGIISYASLSNVAPETDFVCTIGVGGNRSFT